MRVLGALLVLLSGILVGCSERAALEDPEALRSEALETLLQHLDQELPGLSEADAYYAAGDVGAAQEQLLSSVRASMRRAPATPPQPLLPGPLKRAEDALRDTFTHQGVAGTPPRLPGGGLDWAYRGPRDDPEWAWFQHRHSVFLDLYAAYAETGERAYLRRLDALWLDWLLHNPYPNRLTFSSPWRALEVARRILEVWPPLWHALQEAPEFRPLTRLLVLRSVLDHADALREHTSFWGGNHLLTEKTALLALAQAWPQFRDAAAWRHHAIEAVTAQLDAQIYPDGAHKELSNHYQRVVLQSAQRSLALLAGATDGVDSPEYSALKARVGLIRAYFAGIMRPDGFGPLNNDSDLEHNAQLLKPLAEHFPAQEVEAGAPAGSSRWFPWAGHAVLRNDRPTGPGAHWAFMDLGPYGRAHQHRDSLHVSLARGSQMLLTDTGRYTYRPGPWRDYFQGPAGHNVLTLDGQAALRPPKVAPAPWPAQVELRGPFQVAAGQRAFALDAHGSARIPWWRCLVYLPNRYWLIVDQLLPIRGVEASWRWHTLLPRAEAEVQLIPLGFSAGTETRWQHGAVEPEIAGWWSQDYNLRTPIWQLTVAERLAGLMTRALLVLPGALPEAERPTAHLHQEPGGEVVVAIRWPDGSDERWSSDSPARAGRWTWRLSEGRP